MITGGGGQGRNNEVRGGEAEREGKGGEERGEGGVEGCPQGGEDGTRGACARTAQEGPGATAVAEKAVAIEEAPALS